MTMGEMEMRGYGQFCPVAKAAEIFAERWTPLILRELLSGSRYFSDLQRGIPLISRALLAQRLKELEAAGVVTIAPKSNGPGHEYRLTEAGLAFRPIIESLNLWGQRYIGGNLGPADLDGDLLMFTIRQYAQVSAMPAGRVVVRFEFRGIPKGNRSHRFYWLILENGEIDICYRRPGFEEDLVIRADLGAFTRAWLGYADRREEIRAGRIAVEGPAHLAQSLWVWMGVPDRAKGAWRLYPTTEPTAASAA
jgi:DNA-binding HxlR family transcriptional regulator